MIFLEFIFALTITSSLVIAFHYKAWSFQEHLQQKIQEQRQAIEEKIQELNRQGGHDEK